MRRRRQTLTLVDAGPPSAADALPWLADLPRETAAHGWIVLKLYRVPTRAEFHAYLSALAAGDVEAAERLYSAWPQRSVEELREAQEKTGLVW